MISPVITAELRNFCETTSVRGVSRIIRSKSTALYIIWLIGVLTCAGCLIWQLVVISKRYASYQVNTVLGQPPTWDNPTFPDITICNLCPLVHDSEKNVRYTDYLLKTYIPKTYDKSKEFFEQYNSSLEWYDYRSLMNYIASPQAYFNNFPISDVYDGRDPNPPILDYSYFNWDYTVNNNYRKDYSQNIQRIWDPDYYTCYVYRLAKSERKNVRGFTTILYVDEFLDSVWIDYNLDITTSRSTGMRVMIHEQGTLADMKLGMSIAPGMETTITLSQTSHIHLSSPFSNCTTQDIIGSHTNNASYTVEYCYHVCLQNQFIDKCGCITSWLQFTLEQFIDANSTICGNLGITEANSMVNWEGMRQFVCSTMISLAENACHTKCLTPCQENRYSTSVTEAPWPHVSAQIAFYYTYIMNSSRFSGKVPEYKDAEELALTNRSAAHDILKELDSERFIRDNFLQLNVRFDRQTYVEQKDVAAFSFDAFGAQIGGVLSLWLGVTAILVFELCEFIFNVMMNYYRERKKLSASSLEIFISQL